MTAALTVVRSSKPDSASWAQDDAGQRKTRGSTNQPIWCSCANLLPDRGRRSGGRRCVRTDASRKAAQRSASGERRTLVALIAQQHANASTTSGSISVPDALLRMAMRRHGSCPGDRAGPRSWHRRRPPPSRCARAAVSPRPSSHADNPCHPSFRDAVPRCRDTASRPCNIRQNSFTDDGMLADQLVLPPASDGRVSAAPDPRCRSCRRHAAARRRE